MYKMVSVYRTENASGLTVMIAKRGPSRTQRWGWTAYRNQHLHHHIQLTSAPHIQHNFTENPQTFLLFDKGQFRCTFSKVFR